MEELKQIRAIFRGAIATSEKHPVLAMQSAMLYCMEVDPERNLQLMAAYVSALGLFSTKVMPNAFKPTVAACIENINDACEEMTADEITKHFQDAAAILDDILNLDLLHKPNPMPWSSYVAQKFEEIRVELTAITEAIDFAIDCESHQLLYEAVMRLRRVTIRAEATHLGGDQ